MSNIENAILHNRIHQLDYYLQNRPDLFRTVYENGTWLHRAVTNGKAVTQETLRFILDNGGRDVIEAKDSGRHTALFAARCYGNSSLAPLLIDYGADNSPEAMHHNTDLHFAVRQGDLFAAEKIAETIPPVGFHAANDRGETPFDCLRSQLMPYTIPDFAAPLLRLLLSHRAHYHPEEGLWWPQNDKDGFFFHMLADRGLLPTLFKPEYWQGIEHEAVVLRDRILHADKSLQAKMAEIDFSPYERAAAAHHKEEGRFAGLLKKTSRSNTVPGDKNMGRSS